jgi:hypothetical protein
MNFSFYIIFHKRTYLYNTSDFTEEDIRKYFVWFGVNEKIPKQVHDKMKSYPILYEYELPWYDASYQAQNFYQNSVFFHLWKNSQVLPKKYVGFAQYDMRISADKFLPIAKQLEEDNGRTLVGVYNYPQETCFDILKPKQWQMVFLDSYNLYYNQQHTLESIHDVPYFLYHTFILPTDFFLTMMPFVHSFVPDLLHALNSNTRHLAGTLERVFAFCLACAMVENRFDRVLILNDIDHIEAQREEDLFRGLIKGNFVDMK